MKVKFTEDDIDALETAYYDNEGYVISDYTHTSSNEAMETIRQLWQRMIQRQAKELG